MLVCINRIMPASNTERERGEGGREKLNLTERRKMKQFIPKKQRISMDGGGWGIGATNHFNNISHFRLCWVSPFSSPGDLSLTPLKLRLPQISCQDPPSTHNLQVLGFTLSAEVVLSLVVSCTIFFPGFQELLLGCSVKSTIVLVLVDTRYA